MIKKNNVSPIFSPDRWIKNHSTTHSKPPTRRVAGGASRLDWIDRRQAGSPFSPERAHVEPVMDTIVPTDAVLTQGQALTGTRNYFTIRTSRYYQTQRDQERSTSKIVFIGKRLMLMPNIFTTLLISE